MLKKYNINYLNTIKNSIKKQRISNKITKIKKTLKIRIIVARIKSAFSLKKIYLYDKNLWYIQKKNILLYKNFFKINTLININNSNKNLLIPNNYE